MGYGRCKVIRRVLAVLLALASLLFSPLPARAVDSTAPTWEVITVGASAVGLSATTYEPTDGRPVRKECLVLLETAQVRWRVDGAADPSSTVGSIFDPGGVLRLQGWRDMKRFRAIRTGSTSGVLSVTCW